MKHLLLLFICTVSLTVWGQVNTLPYTQTFDGPGPGLPTDWTSVDNNGAPDQGWIVGDNLWGTKIPALDGNYALLNSDAYGPGSQDADLISPVFNLSGPAFDGSVIILHFDHFFYQYSSLTDTATLSYSINGGASWNVIKTWNYSSTNGETFNQEIPGIAGQPDVRFKWNYIGEYSWGWAVDNVSVTEMNTRTWTADVDDNWNNPLNYFEGLAPDASSRVNIGAVVTNSPVIGINAECYDLTISTEMTTPLTISPGNTLTVYGTLTNEDIDGILIEADTSSSGSLIAGSTGGTGTAKVQVYLDTDGDGWHDVSSPVAQSIGNFLTAPANANIPTNVAARGMTSYNTGLAQWNSYYTDATAENFEAVKGYLLRTSSAGNLEFNGNINYGPLNIPISPDWNLIGNPYTSAVYVNFSAGTNNFLTWNEGILNDSFEAIYVWDGTTSSYDIINQASGSEYLGIGQGFFIKTGMNTTADFTPAMQVHQPYVVLKSETVLPEIELAVSNGKKSFSTSIKFFKDATLGLDRGYDAGIFKADKTFSIFTHLVEDNNVEFGLQCLPFPKSEGMIIPVGIDCKAGGDVTISLSATTVPANYDLVLEDRLMNKFIPFNEANSFYSATLAAETKGIGRFYLHVKSAQTTGIDNLPDAKINAWMDRDEIVVKGVTENNTVAKLYDARGSLILMKNLENTNTNRIKVNGINTGIYMLQVIENGKRTTSKLQISGN